MNVLVDTPIWSLAFRRGKLLSREDQFLVSELAELIDEGRVALFGSIRQELLSGIPDPEQFTALREKLHAFDDLAHSRSDYERAANSTTPAERPASKALTPIS